MHLIHKLFIFCTFLGVVLATLTGPAIAAEKADYVFKNGAMYTIDSKNPTAQAIAITGKYITYVGTNEGVKPFIGDKTQVIDLMGRCCCRDSWNHISTLRWHW